MNNTTEEELKDSNSFTNDEINIALQISGLAIWEYNPSTNCTKYSDNWYYMLGYDSNDLTSCSHTFFKLLHPNDKNRVLKTFTTFGEQEMDTLLEVQYRMKTKSEEWKWVRNRCSKTINNEGETIWLGTVYDISKLKETENQVTNQNLRLNDIVNSLTDIIYEIDEGFIIINCWVPDSHKNVESIRSNIGKNINQVFPKRPLQVLKELITKTINSGKPQQAIYHSTKRNKHYLSRTNLVINQITNLKSATVVIQDITEQENTRIELVKKEANLRAMISNTKDVFWALDINKNILLFNQAFDTLYEGISGKTAEIGKPLYNGMLLDSTTEKWEAIHERSLKGLDSEFSKQIYFLNGKIRLYEFHINPLKNVENEIIGSVVTGRDIDEIYQAKKQAENAAKLKSKFVSTISHEIRTPLNAILGTCHQLNKNNTQDNLIDDINILNLASENLLSLINDVLDFTKLESGKSEVKNTKFDFIKFTDALAQLSSNFALFKNIKFNYTLSDNLPSSITTDKTKLHQILTNLLSNAVKFTNSGNVTFKVDLIRTKNKKHTIGFTIMDSGIGIPKNELNTIFDSFIQSSTSTKMLTRGTGLGLTITRNLVHVLNGSIKVTSVINEGSTFYFELDVDTSSDLSIDSTKTNYKKSLDGIKVLVAEDNEINAKIISRLIKQWNANCDVAVNGQIAIDLACKNDYDLILMDIQMPLKNGFEASKEIRENDCSLNISTPIIALTAQPDFSFDPSYEEGLFNGYVLKPFMPDKLKQNILGYI